MTTLWQCPECGYSSSPEEFKACEVYCEDCGSHPAVECPQCFERIDMIYWGDRDGQFQGWETRT
jgi:transcription elongation factor Elf1